LKKSFVKQYSPISGYGGWGLRLGLNGIGKAYNVSGEKVCNLNFLTIEKLL
jgi:hypothetical protein